MLVLQVTNAGLSRPGYEASTEGVRSCLETHHIDAALQWNVRKLVFINV